MENPDNKKELDKVPDVDKNGEPIYKIDKSGEEASPDDQKVPVFIQDNPDAPQRNEQDLKDDVSEE